MLFRCSLTETQLGTISQHFIGEETDHGLVSRLSGEGACGQGWGSWVLSLRSPWCMEEHLLSQVVLWPPTCTVARMHISNKPINNRGLKNKRIRPEKFVLHKLVWGTEAKLSLSGMQPSYSAGEEGGNGTGLWFKILIVFHSWHIHFCLIGRWLKASGAGWCVGWKLLLL